MVIIVKCSVVQWFLLDLVVGVVEVFNFGVVVFDVVVGLVSVYYCWIGQGSMVCVEVLGSSVDVVYFEVMVIVLGLVIGLCFVLVV